MPVKTMVAPTKKVIMSPFSHASDAGFTSAVMTAVRTHSGKRLVKMLDILVNLVYKAPWFKVAVPKS